MDFQTLPLGFLAIYFNWTDLIHLETHDIVLYTSTLCAGCKKSYATILLTNDLDTASFHQQLWLVLWCCCQMQHVRYVRGVVVVVVVVVVQIVVDGGG